MRLLCFSDWLLGRDPLPPQFGERVRRTIDDFRPDQVWLLGNMLYGDVGVTTAFVDHDVLEMFGTNGWLSRLPLSLPRHYMPSTHDCFVLAPEHTAEVNHYMPDLNFHHDSIYVAPDGYPKRVLMMDGWQARYWPRFKPTLWQRLRGITENQVATALMATIAHGAIRRSAVEIAADAHENITGSPEVVAVVHGGNEPYFGCFGGQFAGCPGGREWAVLVDLDATELSGLVRVSA